jgi:anti-anti-sigma factor
MVIKTQSETGRCILQLEGRFDANWADHVAKAIESAIRSGEHTLELDIAGVSYISSAGIRVLLKYYKQLKAVGGSLSVQRPSETVFSVLRLSGLTGLLMHSTAAAQEPPAVRPTISETSSPRRWTGAGVEWESYPLSDLLAMEGQLWGTPEAFAKGQLTVEQSKGVRCTPDLLLVGLGAFGQRPEEASSRFGETLAVAGIAVTQPTDGSSVPDYQLTEGDLVPELQLLYGIGARGQFSRLIRFEAVRSERGVVSLTALVETVLEQLQSTSAAFAMLAESASIVGATLKRSPSEAGGQSPLSFPGVRDWLNFTTERTDERNLVLMAGVAARQAPGQTSVFLRPFRRGIDAQGHVHAAVFPYRPLAKGKLDFRDTLASVLGTDSAQSVMHLLADEREFEGVGETDLMRGACWAGPLHFAPELPPQSPSEL